MNSRPFSPSGATAHTAFKAFLSHRYRSPDINLYFYGICSRNAEVQFEVDEGVTPISMARLVRMVRDADAFIGIYPFPAASTTRATRTDLEQASRYFRLELSLATRSRLPMLTFFDERYRSVLTFPDWAHRQGFSAQEVSGRGGMPSEQRHLRAFEDFYREVSARMSYQAEAGQRMDRGEVGLLLPPERYSEELVSDLSACVNARGYRAVVLQWPASTDVATIRAVTGFDWLVFDPGEGPEGAASLGWLDGQGVPLARLHRTSDGVDEAPAAEKALFRAFEVGYTEDRLSWSSADVLLADFETLVDRILAPVRRINTFDEAETYFRDAERRPQTVFLSYASEDADVATQLSAQLKRKFGRVFDYRDGQSMVAGAGYPQQLYDKLQNSDIGVPVLSADYLGKGTCTHEAQDMCASSDSHKMFVFPVNVDGSKAPSYFRSVQFEAVSRKTFDAELVVDKLMKGYDIWRADRSARPL